MTTGSCHCGAVRFVVTSQIEVLTTCDCSLCAKRNALMARAPAEAVKVVAGEDMLTLYQWNTRRARHYFCRVCGIYVFHHKRSEPGFCGVNVFCLEGVDIGALPVRAAGGADMTIEDPALRPDLPGPRLAACAAEAPAPRETQEMTPVGGQDQTGASHHEARVVWRLRGDFPSGRYSRAHEITFAPGVWVPGSASPAVVPLPFSSADAADPEAMFTASLSACHMLWFLHRAREAGYVVSAYEDRPTGILAVNAEGRTVVTEAVLRPLARFEGAAPAAEALGRLHDQAHADCFLAGSVTTRIRVIPTAA